MTAMLAGHRVLDLGGHSTAACGRFLATLGADVVLVEPPGGHAARQDAAYLAYAVGKRSATVAPDDLARLLAAADIVLAAAEPPSSPANPGLIRVAITPFGLTGPRAGWLGGELVASALGGPLAVTGYEDRAPVKEAGDACLFHANGMAATGALFALFERGVSGLGQAVDVSVQEVAAGRCTNGVLAWQFDRKLLRRTGVHIAYGNARVRCVWTLKDGYCFHSLMSGRFGAPANAALSAWMDEAGVDNPLRDVDWQTYNRSTLPAETRAEWEAAMDAFFRTRTRAEISGEGRGRGINAVAANEPGDILADPHLAARGFFGEVEGEGVRLPTAFVRAGETPALRVPAPGAHTATVLAEWTPRPAPEPRPAQADKRPLAGVKVLDFSWALVGSHTTKMLADFGATVVKVESASRPCLSRIDVQVAASKPGNFDDKPWFIHMNTSKLGLRLNMKHPRWREVIDPLIDWADLVVENFSPGTMDGLGLGYEQLRARKRDIVLLSGSVYGQTGPLAKEWGVDGTGAALSGRLALTGWPDRPPVTPSAVPYGDVVLPPFMAAAAAAALDHRRRTGEGIHLDASMYEVCVQQMAAAMLQAQRGAAPVRAGNRAPDVLFQAVLPCAGDDRWIAITAADAAAWDRLTATVGGAWPAPAEVPSQRDDLESRLAAWTATQEPFGLMDRLQAAGVAAGVVQDAADLVERDPQLRARRFLERLDNPVLGAFEHQAPAIKLSRTPHRLTTAPGLGQHSRQVCVEFARLPPELVDELAAANLFE